MTNKQIDKIFYRTILVLLFIAILLSVKMFGSVRCRNYIQQEKLSHYEVFGIDYPYWFGVGQIQQESGCRNILSRDGIGSEGLPQITLKVWKKYLNKYAIYNIGSIRNQIKAQALIMRDCKKQAFSSHLWVAYQIYNGGSLVNKEIIRARRKYNIREVCWGLAKQFCKRKVIHFNNGQTINACKINYGYSKKVYRYGIIYKTINSNYKFW